MANTWHATNPPQIKLDTQNGDANYAEASDNYVSTGVKYSTQMFCLASIEVSGGANGNDIVIQTLPSADLTTARTLINWKLETTNLDREKIFPPNTWVHGLFPLTIDGSCEVRITYA